MYQLYGDFNLVKKGQTNLGMSKPPPPFFGLCPKENVPFLMMSSLTRTYLLGKKPGVTSYNGHHILVIEIKVQFILLLYESYELEST